MEEPLMCSESPSTKGEKLYVHIPNGDWVNEHYVQIPSDQASIEQLPLSSLGVIKEQIIYGNASLQSPPIGITDPEFVEPDINSVRNNNVAPTLSSSNMASQGMDSRVNPNSVQGEHLPHCRGKCLHKSRTAPILSGMHALRKAAGKSDEKEKPLTYIKQALIMLVLYLTVGVAVHLFAKDDFRGTETNSYVDALYFSIVTLCTVGYGDIIPMSAMTKFFSCVFSIVGIGFVYILLGWMVDNFLNKQESILLKAVKGKHHEIAQTYLVDINKGRMRIRMKVALALGVVITCIVVGAVAMHSLEELVWIDAFYLSVISVTTVGFGDKAFSTLKGRSFACIWVLLSTLAVARAFVYLAEARNEKRHRFIAKLVLQKDLTVDDLVEADIDNNGFVSKSEFVVYKLKQMGKVGTKDIDEISKQFDRLDTQNAGKITLSLLSKAGH